MIIVDASVALAWGLADEEDEYAERLLEIVATQRLAAPAHWPIEVANGLLVAERRGRITKPEAAKIGQMLNDLGIEVVAVELGMALRTVLDVAREHRLTAYDAAYLELARFRGAALATLDNRLRGACSTAGVALA